MLIIKKYLIYMVCLLITLGCLVGCNNSQNRDEISFVATVLENNESYLLVEPKEGSSELSSADRISVSIDDEVSLYYGDKKITVDEIKTGDQVEIIYDGTIAESYPAQIHNCFKVIKDEDIQGEEKIVSIGNPTAEDVLTKYNETDIFVMGDVVYVNAEDVDWVQELELTKGEEVLEITNQSSKGEDFIEGTASVLPIGTKIYKPVEKGDVYIAVVDGREIRYLGWREG